MLGKNPFIMGCNVLAVRKNGKNYGMTCAWAQMIGFEKIMMLVGEQSDTGKVLEPGDFVGVSALAKGQEDISTFIGSHHSRKVDKFKDIKHTLIDSAILIDGAKTRSICVVQEILHLDGIEDDNFVILDIFKCDVDKDKEYLIFDDTSIS